MKMLCPQLYLGANPIFWALCRFCFFHIKICIAYAFWFDHFDDVTAVLNLAFKYVFMQSRPLLYDYPIKLDTPAPSPDRNHPNYFRIKNFHAQNFNVTCQYTGVIRTGNGAG